MREQDSLRFDRTLSDEQRTLTGSFYTPEPISRLMCALAISHYLSEQLSIDQLVLFQSLTQKNRLSESQFLTVAAKLKQLKLADLCAGTGAFPLAYLNMLSQWCQYHGACREEEVALIIWAAENFMVIDIQPEPLAVYRQMLFERYGIQSPTLPIYCLDSLVDDALGSIGQLSDFDLLLGNPPYLGEKSHKAIFQQLRQQPFGARYYEGRMDYFYYFVYRALELLKPGGILCYITTNYFTTADGAKKLRMHLKEQGSFLSTINFNDAILFKDAMGQHNASYVYQKSSKAASMRLYYPRQRTSSLEDLGTALSLGISTEQWQSETILMEKLYNDSSHICFVPLDAHQRILEKIGKVSSIDGSLRLRPRLGESFHVQQGIVSGFDKLKQKGVFVLNEAEVEANDGLNPYLKAFYKNKQVRRYRVVKPARFAILYLDGKEKQLPEVIKRHLEPYRERLASRREVLKGIRPWYALQWPREAWRFEGPLIAAPQRAFVNVFAFEPDALYGSADIYYISPKDRSRWQRESTLFMTGYLNSLAVFYWLHLKGKRKGSMLELYASPLKEIPIIDFYEAPEKYMPVVRQVEELIHMLELPKPREAEEKRVYECQECLDLWYGRALGLSDEDLAHMKAYKQACGADGHESAYWNVDTL